jgi:hypothetical protein
MSLFDWLLVGHLVGDFLLQSDGIATHKDRSWSWMLRHVGLYLSVIAVPLTAYALAHAVPLWLVGVVLAFVAGTHVVLDRRGFTQAWMRLINISNDHSWLPIMVDQVFHVLVLAVVAQVMVGFKVEG